MTNPLFDLTGRSALVTGAAGGIGSAVAHALAAAGAAVLVTDLDKDAASAVAERIRTDGGEAESAALDVADRASADAAVAQRKLIMGGVCVGLLVIVYFGRRAKGKHILRVKNLQNAKT